MLKYAAMLLIAVMLSGCASFCRTDPQSGKQTCVGIIL